ncbi:response regulator [Sinimarinibacterium thermocellulolyticum]|uniref:Response regulator n=1 Tax=Sinimarinibacterium thermocellulolyticum TaxID=3170016 RepID=A0ABV2ACZ1_9GAMM
MTDKPTLLLIDDEERILRSLAMLFRGSYRVHATIDPHEALATVERERVHVVVSDQRMPKMRGAELLREVRARSPKSMRILLTGYSELDAVVASVNEGEIFRFVHKPWDAQELRDTVKQAADISAALFGAGAHAPPAPLLSETGGGVAVPSSAADAEGVLVIDDDEHVFTTVRDIVDPSQPVYWARSLDQALETLAARQIGVVISELAVAGESTTTLLKLLKARHAQIVTLVLTPFQDVAVFIGLINQGQVYRLLPKPVRRGALSMSIASALRHHRALRAAPSLRKAHTVEPLRAPEELSVAGRIMGLLSRIRTRASAG